MLQQQCRMLSQQKQMSIMKGQPMQGQTPVPCVQSTPPFQSDISSSSEEQQSSIALQFRPPLNQSIPHLHSGSKMSPQSVQQNNNNNNKIIAINSANNAKHSNNSNLSFSDQELQSLLSQRQVTASIAEDLIAQFSLDTKETHSSHLNITANHTSSAQLSTINSEETITSLLCSEDSKSSQLRSSESASSTSSHNHPQLNIKMTASEILKACKQLPKDGRIISSLLSDSGRPPIPPDPPYPPLPKDKLHPAAPSVFVSLFTPTVSYYWFYSYI